MIVFEGEKYHIAEFSKAEFDIWGHSRKGKTLFYSRINKLDVFERVPSAFLIAWPVSVG